MTGTISRAFWVALAEGGVIQVVVVALSFMTCPSVFEPEVIVVTLLIYWIVQGVVILRRPMAPGSVLLFFTRYGFLVLLLALAVLFNMTIGRHLPARM